MIWPMYLFGMISSTLRTVGANGLGFFSGLTCRRLGCVSVVENPPSKQREQTKGSGVFSVLSSPIRLPTALLSFEIPLGPFPSVLSENGPAFGILTDLQKASGGGMEHRLRPLKLTATATRVKCKQVRFRPFSGRSLQRPPPDRASKLRRVRERNGSHVHTLITANGARDR